MSARAAAKSQDTEATEVATPGRYDGLIGRMRVSVGVVREERSRASDPNLILLLDAKLDNLEQAIDLFTRANAVPSERRQFGSPHARELRVMLPPSIDEFKFSPLRFQRYVYVTEEPVELLYLRELIAEARVDGLEEMEPGLIAAVPKTGDFIGFYPEAFIADLGKAGVLRSQIG